MLVAYLAGNRRAIRREVVDGRVNSGDKRLSEANLDLDLADHLRHTLHDLLAADDSGAIARQFGYALAVARAFENEIGDQRHRLGMVEPDPAPPSPLGDHRRDRHQELVLLARSQVHRVNHMALACQIGAVAICVGI